MDEFIENFQDFRDWLYELAEDNKDNEIITKIINKFESLELDQAF